MQFITQHVCTTLQQRCPNSLLPYLRPSLACYSRLPTFKDPERSRKGQGWKRRKKERSQRRQEGPSSQPSPSSFPPESHLEAELPQSLDDGMKEVQGSSRTEIHVYWDLDNLPPYDCPPEEVVPNIKEQLEPYGRVRSISAFGNETTFSYIPPSFTDVKSLGPEAYAEARLRTQRLAAGFDEMDQPQDNPYRCEMCGRKCKSAEDLSKHFKQLHEREFKKKLSHKPMAKRMFTKRKDYVERYQQARLSAGAAPNKNIFLMQRLINLGVQVKRVPRKPQAADQALIQSVTTSPWWRCAKAAQEDTAGECSSLGSHDESSQIEDGERQGQSGSSYSNSNSKPTNEPLIAPAAAQCSATTASTRRQCTRAAKVGGMCEQHHAKAAAAQAATPATVALGSQDESSQIEDGERQGQSGSSYNNGNSKPINEPSVALCVISNDSGFGRLLERASGMQIKSISICEFNSSAHTRKG